MPAMSGLLVVIEGLDGAGTTTQTRLVADALAAAGVPALPTANPTDGPLGRLARQHLRHEVTLDERVMAMVFSGDRLDHARRVIEPALAEGTVVLCDRYYLSTLAYQGARIAAEHGDDLDAAIAWCRDLNRFVPRPDVTFYLQVARTERDRRMTASRSARERYDDGTTPEQVDAAYQRAMALLTGAGETLVTVDGALPAEQVRDEIVAGIADRRG